MWFFSGNPLSSKRTELNWGKGLNVGGGGWVEQEESNGGKWGQL